MATERKWRRGTTAQHASFTGADGEVTLDTTRYGAVFHDGLTAGGKRLGPTSKEIQDNAMVYAAVSGTDTLTWSLTPAPTGYTAGMGGLIKIANNNTSSVTGNINALGAKTFKKITSAGLADLEADDFVGGGIYPWAYDGTNLIVTGGGIGGGGGAWVLIDSQTVSGVSSVDFAGLLDSTYDRYMIEGENVFMSVNDELGIRIGHGATPTWLTGNNHQIATRTMVSANTTDGRQGTTKTFFSLTGSTVALNGTDSAMEFTFQIGNVNSTSREKPAFWCGFARNSTQYQHFEGGGASNEAAAQDNALTSLRVLPLSGTVTGTFSLYGLKRQ